MNECRRAWLVTRLAIPTRSAALVITALGCPPIAVARKWRLLCHLKNMNGLAAAGWYSQSEGRVDRGYSARVRNTRQDQGWWGKEGGAGYWRAAPQLIGLERAESSYLRVLL